MKILIKNGRIINPSQDMDQIGDILIEKGRIAQVSKSIKEKDAEMIDAAGKIVAPGLIDMHTHLREPGKEEAETIYTALRAAVAGGFTTVCAMPNTNPPCDNEACVKFLLEKALELRLANIIPIGTITKARKGRELSEMGELKSAGSLAISDDGDTVADAEVMRRAMEYASMTGLLVISHCEDKNLAGDGVMNEGFISTRLGLEPIPAKAESIIVERDIQLSELTGARLHIAHISAAESVESVKRAKEKGLKVTAEAMPHHFSLTEEALSGYDTNLKVNPPLRGQKDVEALKKGLKDGTIDVIATDHAPHPENEKQKEFDYAPFGMIGLETALSLSVINLVDQGYLDWPLLIRKLSLNPAVILGYDRGTLNPGAFADIIIIDPEKEWIYDKASIMSKSTNSPFIGWKLKAKVVDVFVRGGRIKF